MSRSDPHPLCRVGIEGCAEFHYVQGHEGTLLDVLMSYDHTNGSFDLREINVTHMATTTN